MKNFTYLLIFVFTCIGTFLNACSCLNYLTFCEAADTDTKIVEVEVMDKYDGADFFTTYMDIKIVESLQGTPDDENLTVKSYGTSCDIFFDDFAIGDKLVFYYKDLDSADTLANYPNFSGGACAASYLTFSGNDLVGSIQPDVSSMNYNDFKNSIGECADLTLFDRTPDELEKHISIIKNPTPDQTIIYSSFLNPAELSVEVFSSNGQLMRSIESLPSNSYSLDLSGVGGGVYFLRIRFREFLIVKRVVRL